MLKTVEAVKERERELQFREESNSKKQSTSTKLCKQQYLLDSLESYSLEKKVTLKNKAQAQNYVNNSICWTVWRERGISNEISFICVASKYRKIGYKIGIF